VRYEVRDEQGDLMRVFNRKEEALAWVAIREGWTFTAKRQPKPALPDLPDAPF
jgi:hypothetical protein